MSTRRGIAGLLGLILLLAFSGGTNPPAAAQPASRFFPETGHTVAGRFLAYWEAHGGLDQQGYPLSDELTERAADGQPRTVQYFERAVFEWHPEYTGSPYEVLLARLGADEYRERYGPGGAPNPQPNADNPHLFPETGHTVGGLFRAYWEAHGGLAQQGYPLSDEFTEISPLDGQPYRVQYFERAVFELHPEHAGTPYAVLLAQLGRYVYEAEQRPLVIPPPLEEGNDQFFPTGSANFLVWGERKPLFFNPPPNPPYTLVALNIQSRRVMTFTDAVGPPALSGSLLVWEHYSRQEGTSLLGVDLADRATFTIASGPGTRHILAVAGHTVAWVEADPQGQRLMLKDLPGGTPQLIATVARDTGLSWGNPVSLNADYFVWAEITYGIGTGNTSYDVWAYRRKTGQAQIITHGVGYSDIYVRVAVIDHYLIWSDYSLHLADLETSEMAQLYEKRLYFQVTYDGTIFWTVQKGDNNIINALRLVDRIPLQLPDTEGFVSSVTVAGDWIVWSNGRGLLTRRLEEMFAGAQPLQMGGKPPLLQENIIRPPIAAGDNLLWFSPGTNTVIYKYHSGDTQRAIVNSDSGQKIALASDGQTVVWIESLANQPYRIRGQALNGGAAYTILEATNPAERFGTQAPYEDTPLALDQGVLYYQQDASPQPGLRARVLATGAERFINATGHNPVASAGRLLWLEARDEPTGSSDYLHLTLQAATAEATDLVLDNRRVYPSFTGYAISGENVVWAAHQKPVYLYNIPSDRRRMLTPDRGLSPYTTYRPLIRDSTVVWSEWQSDSHWAIVSLNLNNGEQTTLVPPQTHPVEAWVALAGPTVAYWQLVVPAGYYELYVTTAGSSSFRSKPNPFAPLR